MKRLLVLAQAEQRAQQRRLQGLAAGQRRAEAQRGCHEQHVLDGAAGRDQALGAGHIAFVLTQPNDGQQQQRRAKGLRARLLALLAGGSGVAISFLTAETQDHFSVIERRHQHFIAREQVAGFEPTATQPTSSAAPPGTGGVKGRRKSKKDKLREAAARAAAERKG